jgi:YVTN family beta-propeller protein
MIVTRAGSALGALVVAVAVLAPPAAADPYRADPNSYQPAILQIAAGGADGPKGVTAASIIGASANSVDNSVTVFRTCGRWSCTPGGAITMPVGKQPSDVAIAVDSTRQAGRVYVTNSGDGTITLIPYSFLTIQFVQQSVTLGVGQEPTGIALSPDNRQVYISDKAANRLVFFDGEGLMTTGSVLVGEGPWGVAVSPDGRYAYVAANTAGVVSVVDTVTRSVVKSIPVGTSPGDLALDPTGRYLYVANNGDGTVSVIDTTAALVAATIRVGSQPWGVGVTATHAFVANFGSGTVSVIDTATRKVIATVKTGTQPFGVGINGDLTALVSNFGSNSIASIDLSLRGPQVAWSSSASTRSVAGTVTPIPAASYRIVAKKGAATKAGTCRLGASGVSVTCRVRLTKGSWRVSVTAQLPWQPVPAGQQNKRFTF